MIEVLSSGRCVACDLCVSVCPTNVFDAVPDAPPVVARQEDCQTCFICEAYCPVDALFVAPFDSPASADSLFVNEHELASAALLGSYRQAIGWRKRRPGVASDQLAVAYYELVNPD